MGCSAAVGQPGGIFFTPGVPSRSAGCEPASPSAAGASAASAKVLLLDDANPVYGSPKALKVREALEKVPFIVSFGSFLDDTSASRI